VYSYVDMEAGYVLMSLETGVRRTSTQTTARLGVRHGESHSGHDLEKQRISPESRGPDE
jgi:hypothetical protein